MFSCPICECWSLYSVCSDCRKIRHYMSIYSKERVIEILDSILSRNEEKQKNKLEEEKTKDIILKSGEIQNKNELMSQLMSELKSKLKK